MAMTAPMVDREGPDLLARNRRTLRVLLGIIAVLVVAAVLVGIRW